MNKYLLSLATLLLALACTPKPADYTVIDGFAEGTTYHMVYNDPEGRDLQPAIEALIAQFDSSLSIYNPASLISQINSGDTTVAADEWITDCFEQSQAISVASDGMFDITVGPLISAYGFGAERRIEVSDEILDSIMPFVGYAKVRLEGNKFVKADPRIRMDFNAIAKGYSVDLVARYIESLGITDYLVEIGGEIFCRGVNAKGKEWGVGIDKPVDGNVVPGTNFQTTLKITGVGLATSGNYRKFTLDENGNKIVHTLNPKTGRSVISNLLSATIIAPTCATADGYATACMASGLEASKALITANPALEAYLVYADPQGSLKVWTTPEMERRISN